MDLKIKIKHFLSAGKQKFLLYKQKLSVLLWVFLAFAVVPVFSERTDYTGKIVTNIDFYGLTNLSREELLPLLSIQPGLPYDERTMNMDIKSLFSSGNFSSVILRVEPIGDSEIEIFFEVIEFPRVESVEFLGFEELYEADLRNAVNIKDGEVYSLQKVKDGVSKLKEKYTAEGFFLAEIWYRVEKSEKSSNKLIVTYVIDEGENIPVSKINIIGVNQLNLEDMLEVLEQKEEGSLEDGIFRESKFEEDKFRIVGYAKSNGYIDAELDESMTGYEIRWRNPDKPEEGRVVVITYSIFEGEIRYYGGYSIEHDPEAINLEFNPPERKEEYKKNFNPVYKSEDILRFLEYSEVAIGDVYDEGKYFRDRKTMQDMYSSRGYVFTQIQPSHINVVLTDEILTKYENCLKSPAGQDRLCREEASRLNLKELRYKLKKNPDMKGRVLRHTHFVIREYGLAYIESIVIKGMVKTHENVIRRELLIKEGQLYNEALVERSREKLINLGYFKEVNLQKRPGSDDDKMILVIDVEEQPTGTISMGGGYGTATGFSIFTEIGETNLGGTGQRISGKLQYGPTQKSLRVVWTEPWVYERCESNTGNYWREKNKLFNESPDLESIEKLAGTFQNEYRSIGEKIQEYVVHAGNDQTVEMLDRVKNRIRHLIRGYVEKEEMCFRTQPRPWALSLSSSYSTYVVRPSSQNSIQEVSDDPRDFFEGSSYEVTSVGVGVGVSHTFFLNWAHYHQYLPTWSKYTRPTSLANDEVFKRSALGWQYKAAVKNGLVYDNRDNVFNTTRGINIDLSVEIVGRQLGGKDHYNKYQASFDAYHTWFDYTFGGLFRRNTLRKWRVVQEFRVSGTFMHETGPFGRNQNKEINPYIEVSDRLYMGGYETVRGYDYGERIYPIPWQDGGSHMILGGTEIRFPIEPSILWFVMFMDTGIMFDNVGEFTGSKKDYVENYRARQYSAVNTLDPYTLYTADKFDYSMKRYPYDSFYAWHDPKRTVFSQRNLALDRAIYSIGFGLRIQIPVLPLRLYMAQKRYYDNGALKPVPGDDKFEFVFGIGDFRY